MVALYDWQFAVGWQAEARGTGVGTGGAKSAGDGKDQNDVETLRLANLLYHYLIYHY